MDKNQIRRIIANNVTALMNQKGLSITEVARRSNISQSAISKIINATMSITIPIALSLAQGLEVNIYDILHGIEQGIEVPIQQTSNHYMQLFIGILSLNHIRMTCVKNQAGQVIGTSELSGDFDLVNTSPHLLHMIKESINKALPRCNDHQLKNAHLNLVVQSYEFEHTRKKFKFFLKKYFKEVKLLSDWQITYLAHFHNGRGISLIIDKGVALAYIKNNQIKRLGGCKFPVYDLGGENWLGVEALRHTVSAAQDFIPMSGLAKNVLVKFDGKIEKVTETCFKSADSNVYCLFVEPLLRSYFTKDEAAEAIIKHAFQLIYQSIERVDYILEEPLQIALNGSLRDIYKPFFDQSRLIEPISGQEQVKLLANINQELLSKYGINSE